MTDAYNLGHRNSHRIQNHSRNTLQLVKTHREGNKIDKSIAKLSTISDGGLMKKLLDNSASRKSY